MLSPCDPQPCGFCSHIRVGVQTKTRLHTHACDLPASPPTTARPSACRFPRGELDVTHVGPVLHVWGSWRRAGMVVFAPFSLCAQLGAGAAAPGVLQRWIGEELEAQLPATAIASLRLCWPGGRHLDVSTSLLCSHLCPGSSEFHRLWAESALLPGSTAALPASQGAGATAGRSPPLQVTASPSVVQILTLPWGDVERRGRRGAGLMEKSQKRGVNPSSQHTSLTSSCMDASASQHAGSISWQSHGAPGPSPVTLWHSRAAGVGVCCIPPK